MHLFSLPLCFLCPSPLSYCFAASLGDKQQQRRLGKARIFITLSYTEALKRLLQNKSPLRPFRSGVWLTAPGIKKSLFFPRRLAGTPSGGGSGSRRVLVTCGFSVCQKMDILKTSHLLGELWWWSRRRSKASPCRCRQAADGEGHPRGESITPGWDAWREERRGCGDPC